MFLWLNLKVFIRFYNKNTKYSQIEADCCWSVASSLMTHLWDFHGHMNQTCVSYAVTDWCNASLNRSRPIPSHPVPSREDHRKCTGTWNTWVGGASSRCNNIFFKCGVVIHHVDWRGPGSDPPELQSQTEMLWTDKLIDHWLIDPHWTHSVLLFSVDDLFSF